jgi:DNA repair protein RecN (Recombination protein N)
MTTLTGETGAGKSLMVGALAMALGDRADTDRIRSNTTRAEVSAVFDLTSAPQARQWLKDNDFDTCDTDSDSKGDINSECLLRRLLTKEGRSRGYINGQPATMQQLRELGETLIDIHSQHEHQSLLRRETHRQILDDFAGCSALTEQTRDIYNQWTEARNKLAHLESTSDELIARRDLLNFQLSELDQLGLDEGEVETLEQRQQLLSNAESILIDSQSLLQLCSEAESFNLQSALSKALQILNNMPNKPSSLDDAEKLLTSAQIEVEEAGREIQHHLDSFNADPEQLQQLEERLSAIYQLARKHRVSPEELHHKHQELKQALSDISEGEQDTTLLQQLVEELATGYSTSASQLTKTRTKAAVQLSKSIEQQFDLLSMSGAKFSTHMTPLAPHEFGPHGQESIEFLIQTNPGEPPRPLARIASGGELSRISLAIQVIAAKNSSIPTLVFDEVDVGIGGATADVVGQLLRQLGDRGQVFCVTHQPQVAACAHHHLLVSKDVHKNTTHSDIKPLLNIDKVQEIARMLGGKNITPTTLNHAKEMIEAASLTS